MDWSVLIDAAAVVGGSSIAAAVLPPTWLGPVRTVLNVVAANWGHARNAR